MNYEKIRQNEPQFLALTSLTLLEFDTLLYDFSKNWEEYNHIHLYNAKKRLNKASIKGRGKLSTPAHKLFFICYYYKNNPLQQALGATFEMDQSQANKWIKKTEEVLHKTLKSKGLIPCRDVKSLHNYLEAHPEEEHVLLDGVERQVLRSTDYETQKEHYTGKSKTHCMKNNVISNFSDKILYLSKSYVGSTHDKGICNREPFKFPIIQKEQNTRFLWQDTGYQGHNPDNVIVMQPVKKPRGRELTKNEKKYNKSISKFRVYVEHAIGGIKRLRVVKEILRNFRENTRDKVMEIACALHNFRIISREQKKIPVFASEVNFHNKI